MMAGSTLTTFVASDGENIAVQDWPLAPGTTPRGMILLVHGLGEHAGRYDQLARQLTDWGFAVRGYDQYGHGESGGRRGGLPTDDRLLEDLADLVDSTRARMDRQTPLILLGHSMGGLVAARFVALALRPVEALILSSPALDPGLNTVQKLLLAVLPTIAPNLTGRTAGCMTASRAGWHASSPTAARPRWPRRRTGRCPPCCCMPGPTGWSARPAAGPLRRQHPKR